MKDGIRSLSVLLQGTSRGQSDKKTKSGARTPDSFKVIQKELDEIFGLPIGSLRPFVSAPRSSIR